MTFHDHELPEVLGFSVNYSRQKDTENVTSKFVSNDQINIKKTFHEYKSTTEDENIYKCALSFIVMNPESMDPKSKNDGI